MNTSSIMAKSTWLLRESELHSISDRLSHIQFTPWWSPVSSKVWTFAKKAFCTGAAIVVSVVVLYAAISSPPLHLFYDVAPDAGPSSVYLPGGGFPGFWFHFGYLHSVEDLHAFDYYCYSAGCLSVLSVFLNKSLDEVSEAAFATQHAWTSGNHTRYELVGHFFEQLVPHDLDQDRYMMERFIPRIKVLVTTASGGLQVMEASTRQQLKDGILKTTWVPYLTGWGLCLDEEDVYLDGGFSRLLHPKCSVDLYLPLIWETIAYVFSPGLSQEQVSHLYHTGNRYRGYNLPGSFGAPKSSAAGMKAANESVCTTFE